MLPGILRVLEFIPLDSPSSAQIFGQGLRPVAIEFVVHPDLIGEGRIVRVFAPWVHREQDVQVSCLLQANLPPHSGSDASSNLWS